jgi:hypothetical protein
MRRKTEIEHRMKCPKCGQVYVDDRKWNYCPIDGASLDVVGVRECSRLAVASQKSGRPGPMILQVIPPSLPGTARRARNRCKRTTIRSLPAK